MSKLLAKLLTRSFPGKPAFPVLNPSTDDSSKQGETDESVRGYESRAFSIWLTELAKSGGNRLLDFGPMRPASVSFYGQHQINLSILGLESAQDLLSHIRSFDAQSIFDAALCWEYPNYLEPKEFAELGIWMAERIEPGGLVMLSLANKSPYSEQPASYTIVDDSHLERTASHEAQTRSQRYSSGELSKHWPAFEPIRSFLLRSGMQEYVLRRRQDGAQTT